MFVLFIAICTSSRKQSKLDKIYRLPALKTAFKYYQTNYQLNKQPDKTCCHDNIFFIGNCPFCTVTLCQVIWSENRNLPIMIYSIFQNIGHGKNYSSCIEAVQLKHMLSHNEVVIDRKSNFQLKVFSLFKNQKAKS